MGYSIKYSTAPTANQVAVGDSVTNTVKGITVGTNGQVLVGSTAASPAFATLTSSDSSIVFTTGAGTLGLTAASGILKATGTLTNSQIKNLQTTPITAVATPGAGKFIKPLFTVAKLNYGGTNVFTDVSVAALDLYYTNNTFLDSITGAQGAFINVMDSSVIVAAASTIQSSTSTVTMYAGTLANIQDRPLVFQLTNGSANIAGNAANDNTIDYAIYYQVITI